MTKKLTKENHKPSVFGRRLILDNNNNVKNKWQYFSCFYFYPCRTLDEQQTISRKGVWVVPKRSERKTHFAHGGKVMTTSNVQWGGSHLTTTTTTATKEKNRVLEIMREDGRTTPTSNNTLLAGAELCVRFRVGANAATLNEGQGSPARSKDVDCGALARMDFLRACKKGVQFILWTGLCVSGALWVWEGFFIGW